MNALTGVTGRTLPQQPSDLTKRELIKTSSLDNNYRKPFSHIPDKPLTPELLESVILERTGVKKNGSIPAKSRNDFVMAYQQLAKFAGLDVDLTHLKVPYQSKPVDPNDLPTDAQILEIWESITYAPYKWVYGMLATYGLRPHELFKIEDYDAIGSTEGIIVIGHDSKTGRHEVYTFPDRWRELFDLTDVRMPNISTEGKTNQEIGAKVCQGFRQRKIPHNPYALRHAYAIRTALAGVPDSVAAKWMGHSVAIHTKTYHQAISKAQHKKVWEKANREISE